MPLSDSLDDHHHPITAAQANGCRLPARTSAGLVGPRAPTNGPAAVRLVDPLSSSPQTPEHCLRTRRLASRSTPHRVFLLSRSRQSELFTAVTHPTETSCLYQNEAGELCS